jgi:predicted transposase YbfD/YdcC
VEDPPVVVKSKSLVAHLSVLPDPRKTRGLRHKLLDIMVIAVLATICGEDDWEGVESFGLDHEDWLRTFLDLPNAIPSHDTFNRVFRLLDPQAFREMFLGWVKQLREKIPGDVVALDGKVLRASMDGVKSPLDIVSAWSSQNGMVLGQVAVDQKSNEVKALPELIKVLHLKGCIVTIDAMGCQKDVAKLLTTRKVGADYILAVKGNQGMLHRRVQEAFAGLDAAPATIPHFVAESSDRGHGRKEFRRVSTLDALAHLPEDILLAWSKCETLVRIESEVERDGKVTHEERFYISSLQAAQAETIRASVRAHWLIENQLHWTLDTAFGEDGNRVRKDNGPECGAVLRHIALNLLRQDPKSTVRSINARRNRAGRLPQYRLAALLGFPEGCPTGVPPKRKKGYVAIKPGNETIHPLLLQ